MRAVYIVTDDCIGAARDERGSGMWLRSDLESALAHSEERREAECYTSDDERPGDDILRAEDLMDRLVEDELVDDGELCVVVCFRL